MLKYTKVLFIPLFFLLITAATFKIDLEVRSLLNNQIELKIPKGFKPMDADMLKRKYPGPNRPTIVYTDDDGIINVGLNLTSNKADQAVLPQIQDAILSAFNGAHPNAEWIDKGITIINGRKVGYLKLVTQAIDARIYNCIFYTDVKGQLLICTFNCTEKFQQEWQPIAEDILHSLKVKE